MMKIFKHKGFILLSTFLALVVGLMFCLPTAKNEGDGAVLSGSVSGVNAYADASSTSTVYLALDSHLEKLTSSTTQFNGTISTNSVFTLYISNTFTATTTPVSYSIALTTGTTENATKFNFGADTWFELLDYSNTRTGSVFLKTLAGSTNEVLLSEFFAPGGSTQFSPATVASASNTEEMQFLVDFSSASAKPTAGTTYYFMLYRTEGSTKTVVGYKALTFTNQNASFTFTTTTAHQTMLSDSTESITLNFAPASSYSGLNGSGWGVRLRVISPANTSLPATTRFVLKYLNVQQGDSTSLEKSFAFDFTQASYTLVAEVMVPYASGLTDGTYSFAFDIFDRSSQSIIATATATFSFVNVNYKVRATTYIQTDDNAYSRSVVYTIGESLAAICHIEENALPAGTSMVLKLEKRNADQTTYTVYDNNVNLNLDCPRPPPSSPTSFREARIPS